MMQTTSIFPNNIDDRSFMSDVDLEHLDLLEQYKILINKKMYNEAAGLLEHSDSFYYGAHVFNMLEDRLYRIGEYLINEKKKEDIGFYQTEHPKTQRKGAFWIA